MKYLLKRILSVTLAGLLLISPMNVMAIQDINDGETPDSSTEQVFIQSDASVDYIITDLSMPDISEPADNDPVDTNVHIEPVADEPDLSEPADDDPVALVELLDPFPEGPDPSEPANGGIIPATEPITMLSDSDFVIVDGVLTQYNGPGGEVIIPDGVVEIAANVFLNKNNVVRVVFTRGCSGSVTMRFPARTSPAGSSCRTASYPSGTTRLPATRK